MTAKSAPDQIVDPDTGEIIVEAELLDADDNPDAANLPARVETTTIDNYTGDDDQRLLATLPVDDLWSDIEDDGDWTPQGSRSRIPHTALNRKLDGGFTLDNGQTVDQVDVVWLARGTSRAYFPRPFDGKNAEPPDCRSFDGRTADPKSPDLQNGGDCLTCPHARWADDSPPKCKESTEALMFLLDAVEQEGQRADGGQLTRIRFGGIAVGPARDYWDSFARRLPRRYPFAYLTHIALEAVETDNGKFLKPRFERVRELARVEVQPLLDERDRRKTEWAADIADDVASGSTAERAEPGPFDGDPGEAIPPREGVDEEAF